MSRRQRHSDDERDQAEDDRREERRRRFNYDVSESSSGRSRDSLATPAAAARFGPTIPSTMRAISTAVHNSGASMVRHAPLTRSQVARVPAIGLPSRMDRRGLAPPFAQSRMFMTSDDMLHMYAQNELRREQGAASQQLPRGVSNQQGSIANRLRRLDYGHELRRHARTVPAGFSLDVPLATPSPRAEERHSTLYASSYVSIFNVLANELERGATRVNAFLPYAFTGENERLRRTPLRNYTSLQDLRENFWSDIRSRLRFMHTGLPGDENHNTNTGGRTINVGVTFLDNDAGVQIYSTSRVRRGSCNNNKKTYPILKGKFADYRALNPTSKGNNCGIHCLKEANGNMPSVKQIRSECGIPKGAISISDMYKIACKYGMLLYIATEQSDEEMLFDKLAQGIICLHLDDMDHYKLIINKTSYYTCPVCKLKLRTKETDNLEPHQCSLPRITTLSAHPNVKVKRVDGTYDLETRSDVHRRADYDVGSDEYIDDRESGATKITVFPQQPTLACLAYYNKCEQLVSHSFFGMNCMNDFLEELFVLHTKYVYLDLYAHNGSRFDAHLLLAAIKKHPEYSKYTNVEDCVIKGTRILSFRFLNHTIRGTENYLDGSLDDLCKSFKISDGKQKTVIIEDQEWNTMDICLMRPELSPQQYIDFLNSEDGYLFKEAYVEYCIRDCTSLLEVWTSFKRVMLESVIPVKQYPYLANIFSKAATLPGTIMKVFRAVHSKKIEGKNGKPVHVDGYWTPVPTEKMILKLITDAKLGGISHVAKPGLHVGDIAIIDVKSLYASVMLQEGYPDGAPIPLVGDDLCRHFINQRDHMAIIRCTKVEMNTNCIADYPARTDHGLDWTASVVHGASLTSLDILRIERKGGRVEMEYGIGWERTTNPFIAVAQEATNIKVQQDEYKEKKDPRYNPVMQTSTKLSVNALFGKMLENADNYAWSEFSSYWDYSEFDFEGKYNVHYSNEKFYVRTPSEKETYPPLQFGVFILGHARERMMNFFDMVGRQNVIASETDSIHTYDKHLLSLRQSNDPLYRIGNKYGNMVVEHDGKIKKALFLGKKCYAYLTFADGYTLPNKKRMKCKGVAISCLDDAFYWTLYNDRVANVKNMRVFRRHLFTDVHTGITIEYIDKEIKADTKLKYHEYNEDGIKN